MAKVIFFAGSARKASVNKKGAKVAATMARELGAEATYIDLADYNMPLYNGDYEEEHGLPEKALELKRLFEAHDGFFIMAPEYNSSFTPLLKNTLDWISRPDGESQVSLTAFKGKVAGLASASPGGLGGMRGLVPLRMMLENIGVTVVPTQACISGAYHAFDDQGNLQDEKNRIMLKKTVTAFVEMTNKLSP